MHKHRDDYGEGHEDEASESNVNEDPTLEFERRPSIMRITTARDDSSADTKGMTDAQRVIHKRGIFKWMPASGGADMYVGSW